MNHLASLDYLVFVIYFVAVAGYGLWVYQRKKTTSDDSKDYFLAEGSLTWWAIGASLIASNISTEQFIGMSGSGFKMGLAIASYEWMASATLIIVAIFFLPVYLKNKIYTMPQFLHERYNGTVAMIMAVFWLLLYIVVNLTTILFLGALAVSSISGLDMQLCMYGLALFAVLITLGGMKVIGYTDTIQVFFLVLGGLATTYIALNMVSAKLGGSGTLDGLNLMMAHAGDHFHMILKRDNPNYLDLPGHTVLIGGLWIANLSYWGCNQYITQRALGADLPTARGGLLFAAFLKLLMPVIVVLPGIAAYVLYEQGMFQTEMLKDGAFNQDRAYPVLLNLLPMGLKGLAFAALTAAVVASLAGKANSIATIFTLDIYKKKIRPDISEKQTVIIGKTTVVLAMLIAILISPYLCIDHEGGFKFIQEYTGLVSPGVFAMFIMGFFWKKTTSTAAVFAMVAGLLIGILLKLLPGFVDLSPLASIGLSATNGSGIYQIPFLDQMGIVFICCIIGMVAISYNAKANTASSSNTIEIDMKLFHVTNGFAVGSLIVIGILAALYIVFW